MFTQFKLVQTGPGAITRRVTFAEQPTWFSLASRIEQLYGIPLQDVGVAYIDSDGDEITLSTHEELQDYYSTMPRSHNETIKFIVRSIGALRAQNRPRPQDPSSSNNNTYEFIVDDDWQREFPLFPGSNRPPPPPPKSPSSAFVETVDSSVTAEPVPVPDCASDTSSIPVFVTDNRENVPEGKRPAYEGSDTSDASSVSVIHDDIPVKQPVHVMEFDTEQGYVHDRPLNSHSGSSRPSRPYSPHLRRSRSVSRSDSSSRSPSPMMREGSRGRPLSPPPVPVIRITTPLSSRGSPAMNANNHLADPPSPVLKNNSIPDPPLPTTRTPSPPPNPTLPSLSSDVAELLNALTTAFASHPELSEGLKNIVRNASKGAYWAAERDAMVNDALRAAETAQDGLARAAQLAQEDAGRQVSEALSGVFRSLGSIINSTVSQGSDQPQSQEGGSRPIRGRSPPSYPRSASRSCSRSRTPNAYDRSGSARFQSSPPPGDSEKPRRRVSRSLSHSPPRRPDVRNLARSVSRSPPLRESGPEIRPDPFIIPPPPLSGRYESRRPPFYYGHYRPGPLPHPPRSHHRYAFPGPPPPPPGPPPPGPPPSSDLPPPFPRMFPPMWVGPRAFGENPGLKRSSTLPGSFGPPRIGDSQSGPLPPIGTMVASISAQRKAELEEAKQYYKAKKEEWRREKEARRLEKEKRELQRMERMRERERRAASTRQVMVFDSMEEAPPPVPPHPVELVNSSSPPEVLDGGDTNFTSQRPPQGDRRHWLVMNRLAVMGFTPKTHTQLEVLVAKHLKQQVGSRSFTEEAVIANLLEELFHPQGEASGSRPQDGPGPGFPGGWRG